MWLSIGDTARYALQRPEYEYGSLMLCIFCFTEKAGTEEHVFPLAIGGWLVTQRVCKDCNSYLGSHVDSTLNNHVLIKYRRGQLSLAGNSGNAPKALEVLFGNGTLADDPAQKVFVGTARDGSIDVRLLHKSETVTQEDGSVVRRISIDARDASQLPNILQRERKRAGLQPLADDVLAGEVRRVLTAGVNRLEGYKVHHRVEIDTMKFRLGVLKIAYELAFIWLGDSYLSDPRAAEIRSVLLGKQDISSSKLPGTITIGVIPPLTLWGRHKDSHVAFGYNINSKPVVCIKIFDQVSGVVPISDNERLKLNAFLRLDVDTRKCINQPFMVEIHEVVNRMRKLILLRTSSLSNHIVFG